MGKFIPNLKENQLWFLFIVGCFTSICLVSVLTANNGRYSQKLRTCRTTPQLKLCGGVVERVE